MAVERLDAQPADARVGLTAILGAGALGRLWAGYLPSGQTVFVPRPHANPDTLATPVQYELRRPDNSRSTRSVPWETPASLPPERLLVTTKAPDAVSALEPWMDAINHTTPVVLFQNGMGAQQAVAKRWPDHAILAAVTTEGAHQPSPAVLVHAGIGQTWIGAMTAPGNALLSDTVSVLSGTGLTVTEEPDIEHRLWNKLVINAGINPFTAILDCQNGEILHHPFYLEHIDALCLEIYRLMEAAGIKPQPPSPERIREQIEAVARATARNTSSMRADIQRGRPTEINYINGYIVDLGSQLGLELRVNQLLTEQVKTLSARQYG